MIFLILLHFFLSIFLSHFFCVLAFCQWDGIACCHSDGRVSAGHFIGRNLHADAATGVVKRGQNGCCNKSTAELRKKKPQTEREYKISRKVQINRKRRIVKVAVWNSLEDFLVFSFAFYLFWLFWQKKKEKKKRFDSGFWMIRWTLT